MRQPRQPVLASLALLTLSLVLPRARAESPSAPSPPPASPPAPNPSPATVEERLRRLEETNEELLEMVRALKRQNEALARRLNQQPPQLPDPRQPPLDRSLEGGEDSIEQPVQVGPQPPGAPGPQPGGAAASALDRSLEGGEDSTENPVQADRESWLRGSVLIGPGFMLESGDQEFQLQFHNQTQIETRIYQQGGMSPAASEFDIPRQRLIFNGRITRNIEYDASVESAYGTINLLNAFLNFKANDQLMFKFGRFKVPYLYEYFAISNADLLTPERSLFGINFGFNRMPGAQVWGQMLDNHVDYAVGIFDGPRNQFLDFNNSKDVIAYLNFHPFDGSDRRPLLKHLNVGGSVDAGSQFNPVVPRGLKTSVSQSINPLLEFIAPTWFAFNEGVRESGWRTFGSLHAAYFYKHLSLIGEWAGGFTNYSRPSHHTQVEVPIGSYYIAAGYFLTGEAVERRTQVKPLRPFSLTQGRFGPGALELVARYSVLELGNEVFAAGLADDRLWANRAWATDIGFNWYLNNYVKIYLDWQHSAFNQPVTFAPGRFQLTSDLFWLRFQLYF
jgi:phosphate-selective porin OprO/OprP